MPFKKIGKNRNQSPSGRIFTDAQVRLYYATDGFKKKRSEPRKPTGLRPRKRRLG